MVTHSVMFHLELGNHTDRLETERCSQSGTERVAPKGVTTTGMLTLLSVPGKVLARFLLDRFLQQLLLYQRNEQFAADAMLSHPISLP